MDNALVEDRRQQVGTDRWRVQEKNELILVSMMGSDFQHTSSLDREMGRSHSEHAFEWSYWFYL